MRSITPKALLKELRELIATARQDVARQVNSALVLLYWRVGKRIHQDILKEQRAGYGEQILPTLSAELMKEFGAGFTARNLRDRRMECSHVRKENRWDVVRAHSAVQET